MDAAQPDHHATVPPVPARKAEANEPADRFATVPPEPTRDGGNDETGGDHYATSNDVGAFDAFATSGDSIQAEIPSDWPKVPGYEIVGELGRGGMGVVYKARQEGLRRTVALKMILSGGHASESELSRFRLEAEAVARLQHPNIVQIYEVSEHDGLPYFSLEYLDGGSLSHQMRGMLQSPRQAAELLVKLADAVHAAHECGIVHRDLKPANILLTKSGEPKITDFGLAKNLEEDMSQTRSGQIMGTPSYMAPEQARGDIEQIGPATDVYALGAIMYEMLTGRTPFVGATLVELLDQVRNEDPPRLRKLQRKLPYDLETICLKCLRKPTEKRYTSARDLADDLRRFLNSEPVRARRTPLWERGVKYVRRRPSVAGLWLALFLFAVAGASWGAATVYRQVRENKLKVNGLELLNELTTEVKNQKGLSWEKADWDKADSLIDRLRTMVETEPALAELDQPSADLQQEVTIAKDKKRNHQERQDEAQQRFGKFLGYSNDARLNQMNSFGLKQQANLRVVRKAVPLGLALYGVTLDSDTPPNVSSPYLTDKQRASILPGCYELLLAWAHATAYPLAGTDEEPLTQADKALLILDRAAKLGLDTKAYHLRRGSYLRVLGKEKEARAELDIANKMLPSTASDNYLVGLELYQATPLLREPTRSQVARQAIEHLQKAVELQNDHYWSNYTLARIFLEGGRWDAAVARLSACIQQQPGFGWAYPLRAHAHSMLGEYELAEADFNYADKKVDDDEIRYSAYVNWGLMHHRHAQLLERNKHDARAAEELARAVNRYQQAIKLVPDQFQAYANLSQVYQQEGKLDEALAMLDKAVAAQRAASLYRTRARLQLRRRDYLAALADLEQAVALGGQGASVARADDHLECGRILYRLRRFDEALKAFDQAKDCHPGDFPRCHRLRAEALFELGKYRESLSALNRYLDDGGAPVGNVFLARGLVHAKMGNYRAAIEDYTVALRADILGDEDDKDDPDAQRRKRISALTYRGWAHLICEAPFLADKDFTEALRFEAKNSDALCGRGNARVLLGDYRAAVTDAEEAVKAGPASPRLYYNAARVFARSIEKIDAARDFSPTQLQLRKLYLHRSLELTRQALDQVPSTQRAAFWRDVIAPDPAMLSLRSNSEFLRLGQSLSVSNGK
ncbi:MAG: protein kinase [Gemmataceae bacterium]